MPFFKKTAHNRCSVALCAVLVPILTFSLGANLVTLHCEPVRRLVWQSPRFSNNYVRKLGVFTPIQEIVTGGNPLAGPHQ